jgi:hypothetical protein
MGFVDVPEDVEFRLDLGYSLPQRWRADALVFRGFIENAEGRAVSHQQVDAFGQVAPDKLVPVWRVLEGAGRVELRIRRAEDLYPFELHHLVLQVDAPLGEFGYDLAAGELASGQEYVAGVFFEQPTALLGVYGFVHGDFVVAGDDHLVLEVESVEQVEEFDEMLLPAVAGEVACAHEDVSGDVARH